MNLLIVSNVNGYPWAGSETVWHRTAMLALREEHNVTAIIHSDLMASSQIAEFQCAGGKVKNWKALGRARFQSLKDKIAPTFSLSFLNTFDAILVSLGSLPAMTYVPGLVNGLLRTRSPVVLLCQFNSDHLIISPNERKTVREVLEKTSAVVFCSERNLIEARRQFAVDPPKAYVIRNPIRNMHEHPCPWPDESSGFSFASVARLEVAWKGQDLLLDVLSQPQWRDRSWRLRFYGEGPDRDYLERLVRFYNLSDRVTFEGQVTDINGIWSKNHSNKLLNIVGAALYWAEGYNASRNEIIFANTDPRMIKLMMLFFRKVCKVPEAKFRGKVCIHPHLNIKAAEKFWSGVSNIPLKQFNKPLLAVSRASKNKRDTLPMGTFSILMGDVYTCSRIKGWIDGLSDWALVDG